VRVSWFLAVDQDACGLSASNGGSFDDRTGDAVDAQCGPCGGPSDKLAKANAIVAKDPSVAISIFGR
jgi:hypothetical protein